MLQHAQSLFVSVAIKRHVCSRPKKWLCDSPFLGLNDLGQSIMFLPAGLHICEVFFVNPPQMVFKGQRPQLFATFCHLMCSFFCSLRRYIVTPTPIPLCVHLCFTLELAIMSCLRDPVKKLHGLRGRISFNLCIQECELRASLKSVLTKGRCL